MAVQDEIPKSRLTLTYRTEINGQPQTVNLPLRLLVMGDFSLGTSKDRKKDLEERQLRTIDGGNLNGLMKDMKMSIALNVENKVDPDKAAEMEMTLPIDSMKSSELTITSALDNVMSPKKTVILERPTS